MTTGTIDRPDVPFNADAHSYHLAEAEGLPGGTLGVSTVAKIGGAEDTWGIASAWGFRIGYEGAFDLLPSGDYPDKDTLRAALKEAGLTPWATRDKAATRGSWVHDVLEELAQNGTPPDMDDMTDEVRGHVQSILKWYVHFRPTIIATEVQVASRTHGFAGRYDLRATIPARRLLPLLDPLRDDPQAQRVRALAKDDLPALGLLDLKTSKGIYPTTHFPQLEGYEGAGVEMGFPATDFRAVINTKPDGSFDPLASMAISWGTYDDFVAYLGALRAIRRIKDADPEAVRERAADGAILANLPGRSRDLAALGLPELGDMDSRSIGRRLGKLRKAGRVRQEDGGVWVAT